MQFGILWTVAIIVFVAIECISYQLMSIWMAAGSLAALVVYFFGADFFTQFLVFIAVSIILIAATRPLAKKALDTKNIKTNVESIPGSKGIVAIQINNLKNSGTVKLGGMEWSAKSFDGEIIPEGSVVEVIRVEGVKLIVERR